MIKLCHRFPNLKAIYSISTNPVVLHYHLRISDTTTNTPILPVNVPNTSHRATHKVPIESLLNNSNKHLAPFFVQHIPTKMKQCKTETNHRDLCKIICAHSNPQQILNDHLRTIPSNVDHHLLRRVHQTNPNEILDHGSDQRPSPNGSSNNQSRNSSNADTIVCNNSGRLGHFAQKCTSPRSTTNFTPNQRLPNNENAPPCNQQRAYFVTDSGQKSQIIQETITKPSKLQFSRYLGCR